MKKNILVLFGIVIVFAGNSQIVLDEDIASLLGSHKIEIENLQSLNLAFIKQTGDSNSMITFQQQTGESSNQIITEQFGQGNSGFISQAGGGHGARLIQTGFGNEFQLNLDGNLTFTDVRQTGNENMISSNLNNLSKQVHSLLLDQVGNSNKIQLDVLGNNFNTDVNYAISVNQTGNDLAFNGSYESNMLPVEIHQKSGATGEGMSVTVTTSAFYFPMK